jgi:hypothetical protein
MSDPDAMDALVRDGLIVNSGRRRNGKMVWIAAIHATAFEGGKRCS